MQWQSPLSAANAISFPTEIASWSPDMRWVFCKNEIWSWTNRKKLIDVKPSIPFDPNIWSFDWSPDGTKLALGTKLTAPQSQVQLLDAVTGALQPPWNLPKANPQSYGTAAVSWSHGGDRIAVHCLGDFSIRILSASDGSELARSTSYTAATSSKGSKYVTGTPMPLWSSDDKQILLGCQGAILLYDATDGHLLRDFDVGATRESAMRFVNETTLQIVDPHGHVNRIDLATGTVTDVASIAGTAVQFSPDGRYLAADQAGVRRIVRVADGQTVVSLAAGNALVSTEGHLWTPADPRGAAWGTKINDQFAYIVGTASGQQTLTPVEFANKYGWQNDPSKVKLGEPAPAKTETPATESPYLPPMSPIALVQRPERLVAKDGGEPVESWTVATAPLLGNIDQTTESSLQPNGMRLATFGEDGHVRVWDLERKRLERVLLGHAAGPAWYSSQFRYRRTVSRRFGALAWHPTSSLLASVSRDGTIKVWDAATGQVVFTQASAPGDPNMAAWSPDSGMLAVSHAQSKAIRFWTTANWKELQPLDGLEDLPRSIVWSPDSKTLAVCTKSALLYYPRDSKLRVLDGATSADSSVGAPSVRWSPDGRQLAHLMGSRVVIRDVQSLQLAHEFRNAKAPGLAPRDFAWSPDGKQLLVNWVSNETAMQTIHDAGNGAETRALAVKYGVPSNVFAEWLPDGRTLVINGKVLDLSSGAELDKVASSCDWSNDGRRLVVVAESTNSPRVLSLPAAGAGSENPPKLPVHYVVPAHSRITQNPVVWSPDVEHASLGDFNVRFARSGAVDRLSNKRQSIRSWSPNGKTAYSYVSNNELKLIAWPSEEVVCGVKLPFVVSYHNWSPDNARLVVSEHNGHSLVILDVASGSTLAAWKAPRADTCGYVSSLHWVGEQIAVGVLSGDVKLTAALIYSADGKLLHTLEGGGQGSYVRILPGGKQVLRLAADAAYLYDAQDGRMVRKLPVGATRDVVYVVDETNVICATPNGALVRLNLASGETVELAKFPGTAAGFSPDGRFLACDVANTRRLVRVADGALAFTIPTSAAMVSPDGHLFAPTPPRGAAWTTSPDLKDKLVYIVQTASGQQTLTPAEFATKYGWQNDPDKVRLK